MKRLWKAATSLAVIVTIGWTACAIASTKGVQHTPVTYTVHTGDKLWSIVTSDHRYDGKDPREIIYDIKQLNGLSDSDIKPGERLQLP